MRRGMHPLQEYSNEIIELAVQSFCRFVLVDMAAVRKQLTVCGYAAETDTRQAHRFYTDLTALQMVLAALEHAGTAQSQVLQEDALCKQVRGTQGAIWNAFRILLIC